MPKQGQSKVTGILNFFRDQPMDVAELVLGLVRDAMRDRRAKGVASATVTAAKAATGKKRGRKPKAVMPSTPPAMPDVKPLGS